MNGLALRGQRFFSHSFRMAYITVHVIPKSSQNAVIGILNDEIRVKVTAPPDNGKANKAVCKVLAAALGVPKSSVQVASGQTSRHKRIETDLSAEKIDAWKAGLPVLS